jgi:hypothetical protein
MEEVERRWVSFLDCSECEILVASVSSLSRRTRFGTGPGRLREQDIKMSHSFALAQEILTESQSFLDPC